MMTEQKRNDHFYRTKGQDVFKIIDELTLYLILIQKQCENNF